MPKVLVVDDDPAFAGALAETLRSHGFTVATAIGACHGARAALRERPDAIVVDADMPRFTGLELHDVMRFAPRLRHVPVIFLTDVDNLAGREAAMRQGARAYLRKLDELQRLADVLHDALPKRAIGGAADG